MNEETVLTREEMNEETFRRRRDDLKRLYPFQSIPIVTIHNKSAMVHLDLSLEHRKNIGIQRTSIL